MKKWLTENEIYFKTIAVLLLSLMALVVTLAQLLIAYNQTTVSNEQRKLQELEQSPHFFVKSYNVYDNQTQYYEERVLEICNYGGLARDLHTIAAVFFEIELITKDHKIINASIPVVNYLDTYIPTGNSKETLFRVSGYKNNRKFVNFQQDLDSYIKEDKQFEFGYIELRIYSHISFDTIHGKHINEYYFIDRGCKQIPFEEGKKLFKKFRDSIISLDDLTAEKLIKITQEMQSTS